VTSRPEPKLSAHLLLDYLVELGSALMSSGCTVHRLEQLLMAVAQIEGFSADIFAVPTGLFVSVRTPTGEPPVMSMVRVHEWSTDLQRLAELDELLNRVAEHKLSVPQARERLKELEHRPPVWSSAMTAAAATCASAGSAVSFGGGPTDSLAAGLGGLALFSLMRLARESPGVRVLENFLGGVIAALVAWGATLAWPGSSRDVLVLAVIIPLLPGLTLTSGLAELSYRNLVSGTSRIMHASITLLSLVFGLAIVVGIESRLGFKSIPALPLVPASWVWQIAALLVASASFGVLLGLPSRRLWISLLGGAQVWLLTAVTRQIPGGPAAFCSALGLASVANLLARTTSRPAQLFLMPGMLLLVPGALSFRSVDALLRGDYLAGAAQFADVLTIAGALVMGLLVANVVAPPRKIL
jgi:uncharacterized membrane protein YjjP (DUF1212 family)